MKTSHQLARELLSGNDLPVFHFDPSRAGCDDERDTSLSIPTVEENDALHDMSPEEIKDAKEDNPDAYTGKFITISGEQGDDGEAMSDTEIQLRSLLRDVQKNTNLSHHPELIGLNKEVTKALS